MCYKLLITGSVFLCVVGLSKSKSQSIIIEEKMGTKTIVSLSAMKSISFVGGNMVVKKQGGTNASFVISGLRKFFFSSSTDINDAPEDVAGAWVVYPNPVNDDLNISIPSGQPAQVEIFDSNGRSVYKEVFYQQAIIDVSFLRSGFYYCSIYTDGMNKKYKLIKN
jgi:hypothetical protein